MRVNENRPIRKFELRLSIRDFGSKEVKNRLKNAVLLISSVRSSLKQRE